MVRDAVANVVVRLQERGFEPRKIATDSWESRCPAHRGSDHALAITRNGFNHVVLVCRGTENCQHKTIVRSLGITNEHLYAETPDAIVSRLSDIPVERDDPETVSGQTCQAEIEAGAYAGATRSVEAVPDGDSDRGAQDPERGSALPAAPIPLLASGGERPDQDLADEGVADPIHTNESIDLVPSEGTLEVLLQVAATARFFRSSQGRLFARVPVGSRHEVYGLKSPTFREWLIDGFFAICREIPSSWAIRRALAVFEARARFGSDNPSVFVRVGHDGSGSRSPIFIDLGDKAGRAVTISPGDWRVVDRHGVHFRRPDGLLPLPEPSRDGSIDLLRPYVNLSDRDFRLLIAWMATALRPVGPYPILVLYGEQAAAKSTLAKVIRLVIDPQEAPLLAIPRTLRDLMVTGHNGWLLAYDNISVINDLVSDGLCMVSTGGAYAGRALFSNDERNVVPLQRPVILGGIEEFVTRGDLGDRSVYLDLPAIDPRKRRREDELWAAFHHDQARILGGLFDAVAGGLQWLPSIRPRRLPRMADFAVFGEAVGRSLHWPAGTFLADYSDNRREATMTQLEDSAVGTVLLQLAPHMSDWTGSPAQLLTALGRGVSREMASSSRWPKSPGWLTNELRRIAPQLRMHGLSITHSRNAQGRKLSITKTNIT
jgi:hypothetical protein